MAGVPLWEGAVITVVAPGADEGFTLTPDEEDELMAAMAEIERGEFVSLNALLDLSPDPTNGDVAGQGFGKGGEAGTKGGRMAGSQPPIRAGLRSRAEKDALNERRPAERLQDRQTLYFPGRH